LDLKWIAVDQIWSARLLKVTIIVDVDLYLLLFLVNCVFAIGIFNEEIGWKSILKLASRTQNAALSLND
jgi:hypothetical protein